MRKIIVVGNGGATAYNTRTRLVNPMHAHAELEYCGQATGTTYTGNVWVHDLGKSKDGDVYEFLWDHQYRVVEIPSTWEKIVARVRAFFKRRGS